MMQLCEKYSIFIQSGVAMKLVTLIKICLNETYFKVHIRKYLSDSFLIRNVPKIKGCFIVIAFHLGFRICH
jgi:hypothetical protein